MKSKTVRYKREKKKRAPSNEALDSKKSYLSFNCRCNDFASRWNQLCFGVRHAGLRFNENENIISVFFMELLRFHVSAEF